MPSLLLSSEHVTTAASDERKALVSVAKRSQELVLAFDIQEPMVEPLAALAIALDRLSLQALKNATEVVLPLENFSSMVTGLDINVTDADSVANIVERANIALDQLKNLHDQISPIRERTAHSSVRTLATELQDSLKRIFDSVETIRWAALERQADIDIEQGKVRKFGNASAAIAYLRRTSR